jgi:hypothetical protein
MNKDIAAIVQERIAVYGSAGRLDHTARFILALAKINHDPVKGHTERVALLAEAVADKMGKDFKAAFFAGVFHDLCKLILPPELFDGHDISAEEYERVKTHARNAFEVLKEFHCFVALCAGLHHAMYKSGYGLSVEDFPKNWSPATIKKVLETSLIVSVCDHVDASHRTTSIKDASVAGTASLQEQLLQKFPDDRLVVEAALAAVAELAFYEA